MRPFTIEYIIKTNPITPQAIANRLYTKPLTDKEELCCMEIYLPIQHYFTIYNSIEHYKKRHPKGCLEGG